MWKQGWRWQRWIDRKRRQISGIYTLNYDLILETTLNKSSLNHHRVGSTEEDKSDGVSVFKSHGSCDFDISNRAIYMPPQIRLKNLTFLNDHLVDGKGRVEIVPKDKLVEPRAEADIVLPFEFSPQTGLTWVRQGYETMKQIAERVDACIIVGIAYQPCDRKEIDFVINNLRSDAEIYLITPSANPPFEEKLMSISRNVRRISPDDFEELINL